MLQKAVLLNLFLFVQMRLGLLKSARKSFVKAKSLLNGMPSGGLDDNLNALDEHEIFAESIGHNPTTMYEEYKQPNQRGQQQSANAAAPPLNQKTDSLTDEAIARAESGDVVGSLPLFEAAAKNSPKSPRQWENLGVTQVRC